jgi:hypothetical protein
MEAKAKEKAYRTYLAEAAYCIAQNTAATATWLTRGEYQGMALSVRLSEILDPKPADTRTSGEVIEHFKEQLGGERDRPV